MNQLSITFESHKKSRTNDPFTSHIAAKNAEKFFKTHAGLIYASLKEYGDMTVDEIALKTPLHRSQIARRMLELQESGYITPTGQCRKSHANVPERVWMVI